MALHQKRVQGAEDLSLCPACDGSPCARHERFEVVALEGLLRRLLVPEGGTRPLAAKLEVLGQDERLRLTVELEPTSRKRVPDRAVLLGQHGVRSVAEERVPERQLLLGCETTLVPPGNQLSLLQHDQPAIHRGRFVAAPEQRDHPSGPERLTEDTGSAENASPFDVEALESCLAHGEHALRQLSSLPVDHRADQLFDVEGVAARALYDCAHDLGCCTRPKKLADELFTRARRQLTERQGLDAPLRPETREELVDLVSREAEDHEGQVGQLTKCGVHEAHRGEISPLKIFEDEEHGLGTTLGQEEVFPRAAYLVAHQHRVHPRRVKLDALVIREANTR